MAFFVVTIPLSTLCFAGGFALFVNAQLASDSSAAAASPASPILSPRVKAAVTRHLPIYSPPPSPAEPRPSVLLSRTVPAFDDVVQLPDFRVHGKSLPPRSRPKDSELVRRYLGPAHGLDRAVLNRIVLRWDAGIATFAIDGAVSNETRARIDYYDDVRLEQRALLTDLAEGVKLSGDTASAAWIQRESNRAFMRRSSPGRSR